MVERTKELILYLCNRCDTERYWGRTKLFKLLFFCDFWMYREATQTITDLTYSRCNQGPVPKTIYSILEELVQAGELVEVQRPVDAFFEHRPIAIREPKLDVFTESEIALIDRVIERFGGMSAREISEASHEHPGWKYTEAGKEIPVVLAMESVRVPTHEEMRQLELRRRV